MSYYTDWEEVEGLEAFAPMNEISPNLWLGDLKSAMDTVTLKKKNIRSIVSVLPRKLPIDEVRGNVTCNLFKSNMSTSK